MDQRVLSIGSIVNPTHAHACRPGGARARSMARQLGAVKLLTSCFPCCAAMLAYTPRAQCTACWLVRTSVQADEVLSAGAQAPGWPSWPSAGTAPRCLRATTCGPRWAASAVHQAVLFLYAVMSAVQNADAAGDDLLCNAVLKASCEHPARQRLHSLERSVGTRENFGIRVKVGVVYLERRGVRRWWLRACSGCRDWRVFPQPLCPARPTRTTATFTTPSGASNLIKPRCLVLGSPTA